MRELRKWNYETRKYEPYFVPDEWRVTTYADDMDVIVNCPHCGKKLAYGDSYTSHEIHTEYGFGYAVCGECYFESENVRYYKDKGIEYSYGTDK